MSATSIAGVVPRTVATPRSREELSATVAQLWCDDHAFAFVGGATDLELGNPPRTLDTVVRTVALDRVVDYAPEDQTITVEGGMTLGELDAVLAANKQMLPVDVPDRSRTTIGGAIATNAYGRRRHRYGTLKDLIVGVEIVRPDGTRARGGGKVVKNVAGFDLPKLAVGSLGTLGAIAAATLRVYPIAESSAALACRGLQWSDGVEPLTAALERERLEPVSISLYRDGPEETTVVVTFEGIAAAVEAQLERAMKITGELGGSAQRLKDESLDTYDARERQLRAGGPWRARAWAPRDRGPSASLWESAADAVVYPSVGVTFARGDDVERTISASPVLEAARRESAGVVVHAMPISWRGTIDPWGEPPRSFPIMRVLKERFDPKGLCNPGRFIGGL